MDLITFRQNASKLSGGISSQSIKALVLRCVDKYGKGDSLLDFGAGKGELLNYISNSYSFKKLAGVDMFERPIELPVTVNWYVHDLNEDFIIDQQFGTIICSEVIEHLENPRFVFRSLNKLLRQGGTLILTMPNQESIRSYVGLLIGGHFTSFLGASYPAHITALLRMDLVRICDESGFNKPEFFYTDEGGIPKLPTLKWQAISFGLLRGRYFSDNIGLVTTKKKI